MLAPTQICSHMACCTHTDAQARARPRMQSDSSPRSAPSLQPRWVDVTPQRGATPGSWSAITRRDLCSSIHQPRARGSAAAYPPTISITSIFLEHNSCCSSSPLPSFFSPVHLLRLVNVNYISLCEAAPSITRRDRRAQVNWSTALVYALIFPSHNPLAPDRGFWWTGGEEREIRARGCQEGRSGDGALRNTAFSLAYIIAFSGTGHGNMRGTRPSIACIHAGRDFRRGEKLH